MLRGSCRPVPCLDAKGNGEPYPRGPAKVGSQSSVLIPHSVGFGVVLCLSFPNSATSRLPLQSPRPAESSALHHVWILRGRWVSHPFCQGWSHPSEAKPGCPPPTHPPTAESWGGWPPVFAPGSGGLVPTYSQHSSALSVPCVLTDCPPPCVLCRVPPIPPGPSLSCSPQSPGCTSVSPCGKITFPENEFMRFPEGCNCHYQILSAPPVLLQLVISCLL